MARVRSEAEKQKNRDRAKAWHAEHRCDPLYKRVLTPEQKERANQKSREWYAKNKVRALADKAAYYKENKESLQLYAKAWRMANPNNQRLRSRQRLGTLDAVGESRFGVCPVCCRDRKLVLDHDHATGLTRGWLCDTCNRAIGMLGDSQDRLIAAVAYLRGGS